MAPEFKIYKHSTKGGRWMVWCRCKKRPYRSFESWQDAVNYVIHELQRREVHW